MVYFSEPFPYRAGTLLKNFGYRHVLKKNWEMPLRPELGYFVLL
jgi:hypothetical protein